MNHTPGPWEIHLITEGSEKGSETIANVGTSQREMGRTWQGVCDINTWGREYVNDAESQANAHLIAAAPELLEACQWVLFHLEHREGLRHRKDLFSDDELNRLRTAIAKAEGRK